MKLNSILNFAAAFIAFSLTAHADPVSGSAVGCNGEAIIGVGVELWKVDGDDEENMGSATTDGHGVFTFPVVSKGTYYVIAACPSGKTMYSVNFRVPGTFSKVIPLNCCPDANLRTGAGGGTVPLDGLWDFVLPGYDRAQFALAQGQITLVATSRGKTVTGRGVYRQIQSDPSHANNVWAMTFQWDGTQAVHLLMVEVMACCNGVRMHGFSSAFASRQQPSGSFMAMQSRADAIIVNR